MMVSECVPVGPAELSSVLRTLTEITMPKPASILCDSKYIADGCNCKAKKWQWTDWRTSTGLVMHTGL